MPMNSSAKITPVTILFSNFPLPNSEELNYQIKFLELSSITYPQLIVLRLTKITDLTWNDLATIQ